jgi:hypothetical protein
MKYFSNAAKKSAIWRINKALMGENTTRNFRQSAFGRIFHRLESRP